MPDIRIIHNRPLADLTTFRIGGTAELFCEPQDKEELKDALKFIREHLCRYYLLGGGSNTLFSDAGFKGLVISMKSFTGITRQGTKVRALSGTSMDKLNAFCEREGLSGLEFSGGLPGSVGGAVYMNARAYHGEMSSVVSSVTVFDMLGEEKVIAKDDIGYAYKQSVFMGNPSLIIVEVELDLIQSTSIAVKALTEQHRKDRENKGQYAWPSAGCVFKNDRSAGLPSGQLIDSLGLKGKQAGGAQVYERHANFIVNKGGAKAADVVKLIEEIESTVLKEKGIKLEREVRVVE